MGADSPGSAEDFVHVEAPTSSYFDRISMQLPIRSKDNPPARVQNTQESLCDDDFDYVSSPESVVSYDSRASSPWARPKLEVSGSISDGGVSGVDEYAEAQIPRTIDVRPADGADCDGTVDDQVSDFSYGSSNEAPSISRKPALKAGSSTQQQQRPLFDSTDPSTLASPKLQPRPRVVVNICKRRCHSHQDSDQHLIQMLIDVALSARTQQSSQTNERSKQHLRFMMLARMRSLGIEHPVLREIRNNLVWSSMLLPDQIIGHDDLQHLYDHLFTQRERDTYRVIRYIHGYHDGECLFSRMGGVTAPAKLEVKEKARRAQLANDIAMQMVIACFKQSDARTARDLLPIFRPRPSSNTKIASKASSASPESLKEFCRGIAELIAWTPLQNTEVASPKCIGLQPAYMTSSKRKSIVGENTTSEVTPKALKRHAVPEIHSVKQESMMGTQEAHRTSCMAPSHSQNSELQATRRTPTCESKFPSFPNAKSEGPASPMTDLPGSARTDSALEDYQAQLMLLERQNKRRYVLYRQESGHWECRTESDMEESKGAASTDDDNEMMPQVLNEIMQTERKAREADEKVFGGTLEDKWVAEETKCLPASDQGIDTDAGYCSPVVYPLEFSHRGGCDLHALKEAEDNESHYERHGIVNWNSRHHKEWPLTQPTDAAISSLWTIPDWGTNGRIKGESKTHEENVVQINHKHRNLWLHADTFPPEVADSTGCIPVATMRAQQNLRNENGKLQGTPERLMGKSRREERDLDLSEYYRRPQVENKDSTNSDINRPGEKRKEMLSCTRYEQSLATNDFQENQRYTLDTFDCFDAKPGRTKTDRLLEDSEGPEPLESLLARLNYSI